MKIIGAFLCVWIATVSSASVLNGRSQLIVPKPGVQQRVLSDHFVNHSGSNHKTFVTAESVVEGPGKVTWKSPTGGKDELAREIMAGLVVALATIPTSISYSTVVGINPIIGIWNSALVGLFVTVIGGAPGTILSLHIGAKF